MRPSTSVLAALVVLAVVAPPAGAATVTLEDVTAEEHCEGEDCAPAERTVTVVVDAGPGEANALRVAAGPGGAIVRDAAAALVAGPGCTTDGAAVRCAADLSARTTGFAATGVVVVDAGDGADLVDLADVRGWSATVRGGDGDDRLVGTGDPRPVRGAAGNFLAGEAGADDVRGGPGAETLAGGEGHDALRGGAGDDRLIGDGDEGALRAADLLDGGAGADAASWGEATAPVSVDLARGWGGVAEEGDRLRSVEDATGGRAGDTLRGDDRANRLDGGPGADLLAGRGGPDLLEDGARALGGDGDDRLVAIRSGGALCGRGRDALRSPAPLPRGCELRFVSPRLAVAPVARVRGGAVVLDALVHRDAGSRARVVLRLLLLDARRQRLGAGSVRAVLHGPTRSLRIRLHGARARLARARTACVVERGVAGACARVRLAR